MDKSDYKTFIGIDIAKIKFDVAVLLENGKFKHKVFRNDSEGFMALQIFITENWLIFYLMKAFRSW